jgi:hypothetical protein
MDANALKNKAANRRAASSANSTPKLAGWKCNYCGHVYAREKSFLSHVCKGKRRLETMKTVIGQSAFASYNMWMKLRRHSVQSPDTFMSSRFFINFVKFAELCSKIELDANQFLTFIVKNHPDIGPALFCSDAVYALWLKNYDAQLDPWEQLAQSQEYLERLAETLECPFTEVLSRLGFPTVLEAFRKKKLSPWFLYVSNIGREFLNNIDKDDYSLFEQVINHAVWAERFAQNRELLAEMDKVINVGN